MLNVSIPSDGVEVRFHKKDDSLFLLDHICCPWENGGTDISVERGSVGEGQKG